jgi:hypothetical protein
MPISKNLLTKSYRRKQFGKLGLSSSILVTCNSFWQITFSDTFFSNYFHRYEILRIFDTHIQKRYKNFLGSLNT